MKKLKIGFIGNFIPPHSTENDRKWSLEKLGHEVVPFQENKTNRQQLLESMNDLDLLMYSHTHDPSYIINDLKQVFDIYKANKIPTASAHLDRWLWLDRVKDMGSEATWFTEYIFMADGSPEAAAKYDELGLNWHYLKPAVIERGCYMAEPDSNRFPHDIVFVGSRGYHPEYKWRVDLIDWLKYTYGDRFAHYGNDGRGVMRASDLNTLYASSKIAVGDSCFGGRPNYVSDRYYETRGRGGFLIHPHVQGVDHVGVGNYENMNFKSLKYIIDYYLNNEEEREQQRLKGHKWVAENETYTHRSEEMLSIIFGGVK